MAYAQFEPYRKQVEQWKAQGMKKADMLRLLHEDYPEEGFPDKKSSFYPFVDSLGAKTPNGFEQFMLSVPEDIQQLHASVQKISQALTENDEEAKARHEIVMQALNSQRPAPVIPQVMPSSFSAPPLQALRKTQGRRFSVSWRKVALIAGAAAMIYFSGVLDVEKFFKTIWQGYPVQSTPEKKNRA